MPYLVQYQCSFKQRIAGTPQTVQITISKKSSLGSGTPVITQLTGGETPLSISIVDNDKNKFLPVRGKEAVMIFKPQTGVTASTFSTGPDDEWIVEAVVVGTSYRLFDGFLVMDDHHQPFLPISHEYDIELTATDNLGTLSEVPLTDDSGNYMRGKKKIIEIIAQCLRKTGMQLDIISTDTWMEESQTSFGPACNVIYLDMKTFEKKIGEAVSCREALEIIFGFRLSVKQKNGAFWIENIDEKTGGNVYAFQFDYTGAYIGQLPTITHNQTIGRAQALKFINKDAIVSYVRPKKFVKLTLPYPLPIEIIDNIDFSRGNLNTTVSSTDKHYDLDDWQTKAGTELSPSTPTVTAYIRRIFNTDGYEQERYVVLPQTASLTPVHYIESNRVPLSQSDKFNFSVDFALSAGVSGSGTADQEVQIMLYGDDSNKYVFGNRPVLGEVNAWHLYTGSGTGDAKVRLTYEKSSTDETKWQTVSANVDPIPVGGEVVIRLLQSGFQTSTFIKFANLQFDYMAYINGSYQKYSGQSNTITQSGNYKANIDEEIKMGDSPRKLFKGAMFKLVSSKYVLTGKWFAGGDLLNQGLVPPYPPSATYLHPLSYLQTVALWNQYNRRMIEITGSVKGLRLDSAVPELTDVYLIDAAVEEATNKRFMVVGMEQDYKQDTSKITLSETNDAVIGRDFATLPVFKYEGGTI